MYTAAMATQPAAAPLVRIGIPQRAARLLHSALWRATKLAAGAACGSSGRQGAGSEG